MVITLAVVSVILFGTAIFLSIQLAQKGNMYESLKKVHTSLMNLNTKVNLEKQTLVNSSKGLAEEIKNLQEQLENKKRVAYTYAQEISKLKDELEEEKNKLAEVISASQSQEINKEEVVKEPANKGETPPVKPKRTYKKRVQKD